VLLRPLGNTIYVMPPYCATEDELKHAYDEVASVVSEVHA
jgi:adenosylmethionine-8-amino-7-oxononanoate aminotransferase